MVWKLCLIIVNNSNKMLLNDAKEILLNNANEMLIIMVTRDINLL